MAAAAVLEGLLRDELRAAGAAASVLVLADGMGDAASRAFGALPERLALLVPLAEGWQLAFLGGKGPDAYSVEACREALLKTLAQTP